jgi:hypothetical protein
MSKFRTLACALAALPLAALVISHSSASAEAAEHEVTITINKVRAVDRADELSDGDYYARVTIDGEVFKTDPIKQEGTIEPNWTFTKKVKPGNVDVKLELLDKDVSVDDPIDINRIDNKRDLDFSVNTRLCRVNGFAQVYKCGTSITRAGKEKKSAEITGTVTVKR